jgi:lipopolysaccharide export system permease protein
LLAFSRSAGHGELTALHASGVTLGTIARPVLAAAALVAFLAFLLTDVTSPLAAARLRTAKRDLIHQLQTSFRSGLRDLDLGRGRISFESFEGHVFGDICVEYRRSAKEYELWRAERGSIAVTEDERVVLALHNARQTLPRPTKRGDATVAVGDIVVEQKLTNLVDPEGGTRKRSDMTAWELAYVGASGGHLPGARVDANSALAELARRSALAGSAFFFALIAIPLGILTARGGRIGAILLGVGPVLLVYFPLVMAGDNLARRGTLPAYPALWAGNAVLAAAALYLLRRKVRT